MALRSNAHELPAIAEFCRARTKDYFRFDPLLHLRFDGDPVRNAEIKAERLSPEEVVAVELGDAPRAEAMKAGCDKLLLPAPDHVCDHLFHCGAGQGSFTVSYDGKFRLCSSLWAPQTIYDLRSGSLREAWFEFIPRVLGMRSDDARFLETCRPCSLINLCLWCPAHAYLESCAMDAHVPYFCQVAHARVAAFSANTAT